MQFTKGKYRTKNGIEVEVLYAFHGNWLMGKPIKGWDAHPDMKTSWGGDLRWEIEKGRAICKRYKGRPISDYVIIPELELEEKLQ